MPLFVPVNCTSTVDHMTTCERGAPVTNPRRSPNSALNFTVLVHAHRSHLIVFGHSRQCHPPLQCKVASTKQQTDKVGNYMVKILEHLAVKETAISLSNW